MKSDIICVIALVLFSACSLATLALLLYSLYLLLTPEIELLFGSVFAVFCVACVGSDR